MNTHARSDLEATILRALPGLFLDRADLRLRCVEGRSRGAGDALFELEIDDRGIPVRVEVKGRYSPAAERRLQAWADSRPEEIVLLALPKIPSPVRARLRGAGINHADLTGTIYIRAPGIRIDVAGAGRPPRLSPRQRVNPFSKRASLVPRALLAERGALLGVTALAERVGIAKGWVSQVLAEMVARGWVEEAERGVRLADPAALLRAWSLEYTWRDNVAFGFTLPFEHDELLRRLAGALRGIRWSLTLQSGAAELARHTNYQGQIHVYVDPADLGAAVERVEERLHAESTSAAGNLQLLRPYYGEATFHDLRQRGGLPIVSPVQLFLDLAHFPARGAETAAAIARGVLAQELDLGAADVRRLVEDLA